MATVKVNDVNLNYIISSSASLPQNAGHLVVLHGGPGVSDHSLYFDYWSRFSNYLHVVFFDMRGHGRSDYGNSIDWNLEQWGKDVYEFCRKLNIVNPIVAGVSFGGWVALSYALQYPQHSSKLILCNTEACIDNQAQIEIYTKKGGNPAGEVIRKIHESADPELWSEYIRYCAPHMSKNPYTQNEIKNIKSNMELYHHFYQTRQHLFDYLPQLSTIESNVLILGGTDDPEHPLASTLRMKESLINANVHLEIMDGAGDPVYRDFPELVEKIVLRFLGYSETA